MSRHRSPVLRRSSPRARRSAGAPAAGPSAAIPLGEVVRRAARRLAEAGVEAARLEAEVLAAHLLGRPREGLLIGLREPAPDGLPARLAPLLERRAGGEPLQYLTGVQEFWSLEFHVDPRVLIPRPETEGLVEEALRRLRSPRPLLVDVGTGSGCVAVALARELPGARLLALDRSSGALEVARGNAARLVPSARIGWVQADLLDGIGARADLILANPPYVSAADRAGLPRDVRDHEPPLALLAGRSGLEVIDRLLAQAAGRLAPGGALLLEIGAGQWPAVRGRARAGGRWGEVTVTGDFQGIPRIVAARLGGDG